MQRNHVSLASVYTDDPSEFRGRGRGSGSDPLGREPDYQRVVNEARERADGGLYLQGNRGDEPYASGKFQHYVHSQNMGKGSIMPATNTIQPIEALIAVRQLIPTISWNGIGNVVGPRCLRSAIYMVALMAMTMTVEVVGIAMLAGGSMAVVHVS